MPYSPFRTKPDMLFSSVHPVTQALTIYSKGTATDLSFGRESAFLQLPFADGAINLYSGGHTPLKGPRSWTFQYLHTYDPLDPTDNYTKNRDALITALGHGMETDFYVVVGDGSFRKGNGVCNVWDFRETIGAISVFEAKIQFDCANPHLVDQFETGTIQWDSGQYWDIGKEIQQLVASAALTGGQFKLSQGGNTTPFLSNGVRMEDIQFGLNSATPSPIPFTALGTSGTPFTTTPPGRMYLVSNSRGAGIAGCTIVSNTLTGGTLTATELQASSAATPISWDQNALYYVLNAPAITKNFTAKGNAPDRECKITLTGPITGPIYVYNTALKGGMFGYMGFSINDSLGPTDSYVIDIGAQSVTKNGLPAYGVFAIGAGQEEWMRFEPGPNIVLIQATAMNGTAKISTRGHYL